MSAFKFREYGDNRPERVRDIAAQVGLSSADDVVDHPRGQHAHVDSVCAVIQQRHQYAAVVGVFGSIRKGAL